MPLSTMNSDQCVLIKLLHYYLSINAAERKRTARRKLWRAIPRRKKNEMTEQARENFPFPLEMWYSKDISLFILIGVWRLNFQLFFNEIWFILSAFKTLTRSRVDATFRLQYFLVHLCYLILELFNSLFHEIVVVIQNFFCC